MITEWQMYWITRLDNINIAATIFLVLAAIGTIIGLVLMGVRYDDNDKDAKRWGRRVLRTSIPVALLFIFVQMFLPTTKQMAAILVIPKIVNNKKIQELPENLLELSNEWIKSKTEVLKGDPK